MSRNLFTQRLKTWVREPRILGLSLLVGAIILAVLGYVNQHAQIYVDSVGERREWFVDIPLITDFYANFSTELVSIAITILIVDVIYRRRNEEFEKRDLIISMASHNNAFAREAIRILRNRQWLFDGAMEGADLGRASLYRADLDNTNLVSVNLKGADLRGANLVDSDLRKANLSKADMSAYDQQRANLRNANLKGATLTATDLEGVEGLTDKQLEEVWALRGATMESGGRYNGRFNLEGDLLVAHLMKIGSSDEAMASFYGVPVEKYTWGQEWLEFYQSPPTMYSPDLSRWYEMNENPEGNEKVVLHATGRSTSRLSLRDFFWFALKVLLNLLCKFATVPVRNQGPK